MALNVNENTHPVPEHVASDILDDIAVALRDVNRYPDREFTELRRAFAGYLGHDLDASNIWAGNGSNEVLQHILQAFAGPGRTVFGFAPTYSMYPLLAQGTGATWVAGTRHPDYEITVDEAVSQVRRHDPDVILLCAPNNPTGTPLPLDVIEAVYEAARADGAPEGAIIVVTAKGKVVGAHILAPSAGEMIHELAVAINEGMKLSELASLIHVYPTLSTSIGQLAGEAAFEGAKRLRWLVRKEK